MDNQRAKIEAYASLKDLELVEIIEDAGISAKNLNRPGAQRVIDLARSGNVNAVIVYKLDRMFRSTVDALELTRKFDKWGVSFHSIQETLDTQSAMGRFFFTLTAALAEMERGIVAERTRAALAHKKAKGERVGTVQYGYRLSGDGRSLVKDPYEQALIEKARELRSSGLSLGKIGAILEAQGFTARNGGSLAAQQVKNILAVA
jgi:DNA invertase Pin-like site-specific DNA recombinase